MSTDTISRDFSQVPSHLCIQTSMDMSLFMDTRVCEHQPRGGDLLSQSVAFSAAPIIAAPLVIARSVRKLLNTFSRAHGVVVSHPLRMRKALGSNPSVSILSFWLAIVARSVQDAASQLGPSREKVTHKSGTKLSGRRLIHPPGARTILSR